ncbi:fimbrial protein [Bordetella genomosp. 5]|uniref:fimbrial protein n=1 Tax=Bordetella genomosp. 5 TaxID=1395608 RepID=UPI0020CF4659|nr:fimbrial protein [Bordetella genomosp. 5]
MVARERVDKRVSRTILGTVLAANMALAACASTDAPPDASPPATPSATATQTPSAPAAAAQPRQTVRTAAANDIARYGIGVLSPVQPQRVTPPSEIDAYALPPEADPCAGLVSTAEAGLPEDPHTGPAPGEGLQPQTTPPLGLDAGAAAPDAGVAANPDVLCASPYPDYPVSQSSAAYSFDLEAAELVASRPVGGTGIAPQRRRWFSAVSSVPTTSYTGQNWRYTPSVGAGPSVGVGNVTSLAPSWGNSAPIGGIQFSERATGSALKPGEFGYASSLGRLNLMDPAATSGAVDYGASAGSSMVRYGLTTDLTVEGQLQTAPQLTTRGFGTTYRAGDIGTFQAGATQSTFDAVNAWRYRFGYSVNMADAVTLGVSGEDIGAGYNDLSSYNNGGSNARQLRSTFSAGVPISGWGTLSGTYSSGVTASSDPNERRVGLEQSMMLAPKVRFALGADRDLVSGDYEWRARLSMPVDAFMRGRWLGF